MHITIIPSFDQYSVDVDGRVYKNSTGEEIRSFVKNGRRCVNLYRIIDGCFVRKAEYISRLVAEAHLSDFTESCIVVHVDGNLLNDNVLNLKCVSRREALLNRTCTTHPKILDETTGIAYNTYAEAARAIGGHRNGVYLCAIGIQSSHKGHTFSFLHKK